MSFNYALSHDYGSNSNDYLTICVKLRKCTKILKQLCKHCYPEENGCPAKAELLAVSGSPPFHHQLMCSSPNSTYEKYFGILTHDEQICRFHRGQRPTACNTSFSWLSWEPNKMRVGKSKSTESTE